MTIHTVREIGTNCCDTFTTVTHGENLNSDRIPSEYKKSHELGFKWVTLPGGGRDEGVSEAPLGAGPAAGALWPS